MTTPRGVKGMQSLAVEGEASSNHGGMSSQQIQQTPALIQPVAQTSVSLKFQPASTAWPQTNAVARLSPILMSIHQLFSC